MGNIEVFADKIQLLEKIRAYKEQGVPENHLTVMSNNNEENLLIDYPNVNHQMTNHRFEQHNLADRDLQLYRDALDEGKLLLYIDAEEGMVDNLTAKPTMSATSKVEDTMQLRGERVVIDKENVNVGEVVVNKFTEESLEEFDVPVDRDNVTVERRVVQGEPLFETYNSIEDAEDDLGVIRIPITKERIKVIREHVVTEEIIIRKEVIKDTEHVSEVVQHEDVKVTEVKNAETDRR